MVFAIFGGTGFIGRMLVKQLPDADVIPRESDVIPRPAQVIYLVSTTHNYHVYTDPHLDVDTNLTKLIRVLKELGPGSEPFNYISTWFVYGGGGGGSGGSAGGTRETDATTPTGFYSITKLCAEQLVASYCRTIGRPYRILRLCNVVGGDPNATARRNAVEYMIAELRAGRSVNLYRENYARNFMHVSDVCRAIRLVCEAGGVNEVYNIGNPGGSLRVGDVIMAVGDSIQLVDSPPFHRQVQGGDFHMNVDKLVALGFRAEVDVWRFLTRGEIVGEVVGLTKEYVADCP